MITTFRLRTRRLVDAYLQLVHAYLSVYREKIFRVKSRQYQQGPALRFVAYVILISNARALRARIVTNAQSRFRVVRVTVEPQINTPLQIVAFAARQKRA